MNKFIENNIQSRLKNNNAILVFISLFILVLISRWASHLWNFTLVGGAFLFAGFYFQQKKVSVALVLSAMFVSDLVIGFHNQMFSVYLSYLIIAGLGLLLQPDAEDKESKNYPNRIKILCLSLLGSFSFFLVTNFFVWYEGSLYPLTFSGLIECYVMGIPFYKNQLASDILSTSIIFEVARAILQSDYTASIGNKIEKS